MIPAVALAVLLTAGFADDFDDGVTSPLWTQFANLGTSVSEVNGALQIRSAPNTAPAYAGYTTAQAYDLTGGLVRVEVLAVGDQSRIGWHSQLIVRVPGTNAILWLIEGGAAGAYLDLEGNLVEVAAVVLSAETRWLQIRVDAAQNEILWEHGSDGVNWIPLVSRPLPFAVTETSTSLIAGTYQSLPARQTVAFDNFSLFAHLDLAPDGGGIDAGREDGGFSAGGDGSGGAPDAGAQGFSVEPRRFQVGCGCGQAGPASNWVLCSVALLWVRWRSTAKSAARNGSNST